MITKAESYDYPMSGNYAETIATLSDGRRVMVDTQYSQVDMVGDTETLDGIDCAALVADARINGKRGVAPVAPKSAAEEAARVAGLAEYDKSRANMRRAGFDC